MLADLNHDSDLDVVTADSGANTITQRFGSGGTTFGTETATAAGDTPVFVIADDANRDGCLDIIAINEGSNNIFVYINRSDGFFNAPLVFPAGTAPRSGVVRDLDGNGTKDLVVVNDAGVATLTADGHGNYGAPSTVVASGDVLSVQTTGAFEDANDDGQSDLVVVDPDGTTVYVDEDGTGYTALDTYGTQVLVDQPAAGDEANFHHLDADASDEAPLDQRSPQHPYCAVGRFEHLGGPSIQRLASLLTVLVPLALIVLLKRRARREWEGRQARSA